MKKIRIYQPGNYSVNDVVELSPEAGQHVGVVLRLREGASIILFGGDNREWDAEIKAVHKNKVTVLVTSERALNRESPRLIELAQVIAKGERMEWIVQKAVELGAASIQPLLSEHCAYKLDAARLRKKQQQWQAIAIAACEQCGRNQVPVVAAPINLDKFLQDERHDNAYVLEPHDGKAWHDYPIPHGGITLLIGPEGGFSEIELKRIFAAGFLALKLGPRILRTETAAICALSIVQALWGDLG